MNNIEIINYSKNNNNIVKSFTYLSIIMIFIYIIFISQNIPKSYCTFFTNPIFQIILYFIVIIFSKINKTLAIFFMILIVITSTFIYFTKTNEIIFEDFKVIKNINFTKIIKKNNNILINKLKNKLKNIKLIWSESKLGKNLGLNN